MPFSEEKYDVEVSSLESISSADLISLINDFETVRMAKDF